MFTFKMCPLFTRCHLDALRRTAPGAGACPAERRQRGRWDGEMRPVARVTSISVGRFIK